MASKDGSGAGRCPVIVNFDVLEKRWTVRIIRLLFASPLQFNELKRRLRGVTPAVLAGRLRELEKGKLVRRSASKGSKAVQYAVTRSAEDMFACWSQK